MTTIAIQSIDSCAHYSRQGDWAFDYALNLAERNSLQLNVFHFLQDPYGPKDKSIDHISAAEYTNLVIKREKDLRLYYDERIGDYLEVGFRLCEENERTELHRCLCKREFQVLVLGYPDYGAVFSGVPISEFAFNFVCPVVLIGPNSPDEMHINRPAVLLADKLNIDLRSCHQIKEAAPLGLSTQD